MRSQRTCGMFRRPLAVVEVDDGVAILDQVRPDLVGDSPCCRSTRVARKLSVEVPSVREVPRFHAVAGEVHNGDDAQRAGEALGVEGLSSSVNALLRRWVQAEGPVNSSP